MLVSISLLLLVLLLIGIIKDSGFLCSDELGLRGFGRYVYMSSISKNFKIDVVIKPASLAKISKQGFIPVFSLVSFYVLELKAAENILANSSLSSAAPNSALKSARIVNSIANHLDNNFFTETLVFPATSWNLPFGDFNFFDYFALGVEFLIYLFIIISFINWLFIASAYKFKIWDSNLTLFDVDKKFNPLIGTPLGSDTAGVLVKPEDIRNKKVI
jgi:hypothetical protein